MAYGLKLLSAMVRKIYWWNPGAADKIVPVIRKQKEISVAVLYFLAFIFFYLTRTKVFWMVFPSF